MKLLNLGCGYRFREDWTNIDFVSSHKSVLAYDLRKGIPFEDNSFDVVYHSHVLEHFAKDDAVFFIKECYRVLKPGGIIRIAVPDLERIARGYLDELEKAYKGDKNSAVNYDWMMLEMYDQVVRSKSGGEMAKYFYREKIENEDFVYSRLGEEARNIRKNYLKSNAGETNENLRSTGLLSKIKSKVRNLLRFKVYKNKLEEVLFYKEQQWIQIGKFRSSGEIHQWMYDKFSLSRLLELNGFEKIEQTSAFASKIPGWETYKLDGELDIIFKPDSLFMEGVKAR